MTGSAQRWLAVAALTTASLAAGAGVGHAQSAAAATRLGRVVDSAVAHGFSGTVLVGTARRRHLPEPTGGTIAPDTVLYERAVGFADRRARRPIRTDAVWRWASVSKQVTAALVMQQIDSGRLGLDDPIARHLPAFTGATRRTVTIRHLLQHPSGLPDTEDTPRDADGVPRFHRARGSAVGNLPAALGPCAGPPRRAPGASFAYNNCDYFVLGAVLERITGRSYADLVRERLDGLGARSVRVAGTATSAPAILGYMADGSPEPPIELATYGAAGAISGTARDLLAFDRALVAHLLVSPAATAEMWRGDPRLGYAALGAWAFSATLPGCSGAVSLIERRGAILGVQVRNFIAPELGRAVIVFANDAGVAFGEVWQGRGLSHALLAAALCEPEE